MSKGKYIHNGKHNKLNIDKLKISETKEEGRMEVKCKQMKKLLAISACLIIVQCYAGLWLTWQAIESLQETNVTCTFDFPKLQTHLE